MTQWSSSSGFEKFETNPSHALNRWVTSLINVIDTAPILIHRPETANVRQSAVRLREMGEALGVRDAIHVERLAYHQERLAKYDKIQNGLFFAFLLLIIVFFIWGGLPIILLGTDEIYSLLDNFSASIASIPGLGLFLNILLFGLLMFLVYLVMGVPMAIGLKLTAILTDRKYAESINVWTLICLIIELNNDQALQDARAKQALLKRLHDLTLGTSLLALQFPTRDGLAKKWSRTHFHNIGHFILERECWVLAPADTTLDDLRRDFRWLFDVYINKLYGRVKWPQKETEESEDHDLGWSEKIGAFLPRLFGFLIPIGALVYLILNPAAAKSLGMETVPFGLVTLGWSLVGVDKLLGLNLVAGVTGAVKSIKDLSVL